MMYFLCVDFAGTLDWIFVDHSKMDVEPILSGYEETILSAHIGLPSEQFPSDHTALGADITLKDDRQRNMWKSME